MPDLKKYRVYVHLDTRISTDVLAKDEEAAKRQIDALDYSEAVKHLCDREWDFLEMCGGVSKAREVVVRSQEIEV